VGYLGAVEKHVLSDGGEALSQTGASISVLSSVCGAPLPDPSVAESRFPHWFAAYTSPRHEKRVAEHFQSRQIDAFLPLYRTLHRWNNGTQAPVDLPLFPSYIFVRVDARERVRILEVPGVLHIVGSGREPSPLPDDEIEALRSGLHRCKVEPYPYLKIGQKVRIKAGALAGVEGVLVRRKNHFRVVLTLDLIMQSLAVEVDAVDLESVGSSSLNLS
jgi:transcription antitermination factor NusG